MDFRGYQQDGSSGFSGENVLHKSIKFTRPDLLQEWFNTGPKTDVNTTSKWGQTPLHYAAVKRNVYVIEVLLQVPGVDINQQDLNGYNVLHSLIYNFVAIDDWKRIIEIIRSFGLEINQTTRHGYSILHLASRHTIPSCVLKYILESCPNLNVTLVNKYKENFLHSFIHSINNTSPVSDEFKDRFGLLCDIIKGRLSCCQDDQLHVLLGQQDVNGITPFLLILSRYDRYRNVNANKLLKKMSRFSSCSSIPDYLRNYPIHYAVACLRKSPAKLLEMLIETGINVNTRNIFDQAAAHLVRVNKSDLSFESTKSIRNIMNKSDLDFECVDKWKCTPWMYISTFYDSDCLPYLQDVKLSNVNTADINGSTALHYAAYHNSTAYIEYLLKHNANPELRDNLGHTPLDTARKHLNLAAESALIECTHAETHHDENRIFIDHLKSYRKSGKVDISMDDFAEQMLDNKYRNRNDEDETIRTNVRCFIELLCEQVEKYDSRFSMSVFQSGSTAEGTKVGAPDEFDFVLCLDRIGEFCKVVAKPNSSDGVLGSSILKLNKIDGCEEVIEFFDENGTFITPFVFMLFHKYLKQALHEPKLWKEKSLQNLCYIFETPFLEKDMKTTVFMVRLLWIGPWHKQLRIKIDMVPAVKMVSWWPIEPYSVPIMTKEIQDAGCLLMLDTKTDDESFTSTYLKDLATDFIDRVNPKPTDLRVSTAPAEVHLMKLLPQKVRDSYALAKIFIEIGRVQEITSYMVKNCVFHVMTEKFDWNPNKPEIFDTDLSVRQITVLILNKLLKCNRESSLPRFFLPAANVFLPDEDIQDKQSQKWEIKLILKIIGEEISLESDDSDNDNLDSSSGDDDSED